MASLLSYSALLTRFLPTWHLLLLSNHLSHQNKWLRNPGVIIICSKNGWIAGQKLNSLHNWSFHCEKNIIQSRKKGGLRCKKYVYIYISLFLILSVKFIEEFSGLLVSYLYLSTFSTTYSSFGKCFLIWVTYRSLSVIIEILINAEQILYPENRGNGGWNGMEVTAVIKGQGKGADLYFDLKVLANSAFQNTSGDFYQVDNQTRKPSSRNISVLFNQSNFNESRSN